MVIQRFSVGWGRRSATMPHAAAITPADLHIARRLATGGPGMPHRLCLTLSLAFSLLLKRLAGKEFASLAPGDGFCTLGNSLLALARRHVKVSVPAPPGLYPFSL